MKYFLLILLLFLQNGLFCQYAIVADKDGYVNVRSGASKQDAVFDKLDNEHLVFCAELKGNWYSVQYNKSGIEHSGYVYANRLKIVSKFQKISIVKENDNNVILKKDSTEIKITEAKFLPKMHSYSYVDSTKFIREIDGKPYWGRDGDMPTTQYQSIELKFGNQKKKYSGAIVHNLYEPNLYTAVAYYDSKTKTLYIETLNSDGAGGYYVMWRIKNLEFIERLVAYGF